MLRWRFSKSKTWWSKTTFSQKFQGSIIFMSMFNDIDWNRKGNEKSCTRNSSSVAKYARKFPKRHWSFLGLESEEKRRYSWISVAEHMMVTFADSWYLLHPRALKIKGCGRTSTHYNAGPATAELLFFTQNTLPGACHSTFFSSRIHAPSVAQGETESVCHSECSTSVSVRNVCVERLSQSFPRFVILTSSARWSESGQWPIQPKPQVMSPTLPTSSATWIRSTRR